MGLVNRRDITRDWKASYELAEAILDDARFALLPGTQFDTEPLFEHAQSMLNVDKDFDPVLAAAIILRLAESLNLVKNPPSNGLNNG